jgi:hypothetical protein
MGIARADQRPPLLCLSGSPERKDLTQRSWLDAPRTDSLPWLLEPENPAVRYLALTDLLDRPAGDPEAVASRRAILAWQPVRRILDAQWPAGYWMHPGVGYSPKYKATVWQIIFLAAMGLPRCQPVTRAIEYVLNHSRLPDGRFSARTDDTGAMPCLNGNLLRALVWFDYADDPRVMETRQALAARIAGDGFRCHHNAPAGSRSRRIKESLPCAWGAIKILGALAALPVTARTSQEEIASQQAVDFLLAHDLAAGDYPTATRSSPLWHKFGFPLGYTSDVLEALETLLRAGVSAAQARLSAALSLVLTRQDTSGRWLLEYTPGKAWVSFGPQDRPNKWVTLRALRALKLAQ